jgi:hypothetical protein
MTTKNKKTPTQAERKAEREAKKIPVTRDDSDYLRWADVEPGLELVGILKSMRQGKFGLIATLECTDGTSIAFGCPTRLRQDLSRVRVGALVSIEFEGKHTTKSGTGYWKFKTSVFDRADLLPETEPSSATGDPGV